MDKDLKKKLKAWLIWALPCFNYFLVVLLKLSYLFIFMLYESRSSLEGLIIMYGLMILLLGVKEPYADELPANHKLLSWLCGLFILYVLYECVTGNSSMLVSV